MNIFERTYPHKTFGTVGRRSKSFENDLVDPRGKFGNHRVMPSHQCWRIKRLGERTRRTFFKRTKILPQRNTPVFRKNLVNKIVERHSQQLGV